jgi:hypothetical protein
MKELIMKYRKTHFLQFPRKVFTLPLFNDLSINSKWLFTCLIEMEHRFTGPHDDVFYHSDQGLSEMSGVPLRTFKRCKAELRASGLIKTALQRVKTKAGIEIDKNITVYQLNV